MLKQYLLITCMLLISGLNFTSLNYAAAAAAAACPKELALDIDREKQKIDAQFTLNHEHVKKFIDPLLKKPDIITQLSNNFNHWYNHADLSMKEIEKLAIYNNDKIDAINDEDRAFYEAVNAAQNFNTILLSMIEIIKKNNILLTKQKMYELFENAIREITKEINFLDKLADAFSNNDYHVLLAHIVNKNLIPLIHDIDYSIEKFKLIQKKQSELLITQLQKDLDEALKEDEDTISHILALFLASPKVELPHTTKFIEEFIALSNNLMHELLWKKSVETASSLNRFNEETIFEPFKNLTSNLKIILRIISGIIKQKPSLMSDPAIAHLVSSSIRDVNSVLKRLDGHIKMLKSGTNFTFDDSAYIKFLEDTYNHELMPLFNTTKKEFAKVEAKLPDIITPATKRVTKSAAEIAEEPDTPEKIKEREDKARVIEQLRVNPELPEEEEWTLDSLVRHGVPAAPLP